jgi:hypothetical protein
LAFRASSAAYPAIGEAVASTAAVTIILVAVIIFLRATLSFAGRQAITLEGGIWRLL